MKVVKLLFIITLYSLFTQCQTSFPLPEKSIKSKTLCGERICQPGNAGKILEFSKNPYSPGLETNIKNNNAKSLAYQVLGYVIPSCDYSGQDVNPCSANGTKSAFSIEDVVPIKFADGRDINYKREESIKVDVDFKSSIDDNIATLKALGLDKIKLAQLRVKIESAYSKVKASSLTVEGKYSEWALSGSAIQNLKRADSYAECRKYISDNKLRIITAVGLVVFDINYNSSSTDTLVALIDSEIKKANIDYSFSFAFKRSVATNLSATSSGVWQILLWRHAYINDKGFLDGTEDC